MLVPGEDPRPTIKQKQSAKFKTQNPGFDESKTYQIVGYAQPTKGKKGIRHHVLTHGSVNVKRDAIRVARAMVKRPEYSHVDVYGLANTLIYQCHYNEQEKKIISEEL